MRALLFVLLLSHSAFAQEDKTECFGPEPGEAKSYFIYLHGAGLTGLHKRNLAVLKSIAEKKKVRFAVPLAKWQCNSVEYKGKPCWMSGPFDDNSYKPAMRVIEEAADICFRNRDHGLIGFSAGAQLVTSLRQHCVPNKFTRLIAVGHGVKKGRWDKQGLRGCKPQLNVLVGDRDEYKDVTRASYELLKSRDADITYEEFEGVHELKEEPLIQFFE